MDDRVISGYLSEIVLMGSQSYPTSLERFGPSGGEAGCQLEVIFVTFSWSVGVFCQI